MSNLYSERAEVLDEHAKNMMETFAQLYDGSHSTDAQLVATSVVYAGELSPPRCIGRWLRTKRAVELRRARASSPALHAVILTDPRGQPWVPVPLADDA